MQVDIFSKQKLKVPFIPTVYGTHVVNACIRSRCTMLTFDINIFDTSTARTIVKFAYCDFSCARTGGDFICIFSCIQIVSLKSITISSVRLSLRMDLRLIELIKPHNVLHERASGRGARELKEKIWNKIGAEMNKTFNINRSE